MHWITRSQQHTVRQLQAVIRDPEWFGKKRVKILRQVRGGVCMLLTGAVLTDHHDDRIHTQLRIIPGVLTSLPNNENKYLLFNTVEVERLVCCYTMPWGMALRRCVNHHMRTPNTPPQFHWFGIVGMKAQPYELLLLENGVVSKYPVVVCCCCFWGGNCIHCVACVCSGVHTHYTPLHTPRHTPRHTPLHTPLHTSPCTDEAMAQGCSDKTMGECCVYAHATRTHHTCGNSCLCTSMYQHCIPIPCTSDYTYPHTNIHPLTHTHAETHPLTNTHPHKQTEGEEESPGWKKGGFARHVRKGVHVEATWDALPRKRGFLADISGMDTFQRIWVKDLPMPPNVRCCC